MSADEPARVSATERYCAWQRNTYYSPEWQDIVDLMEAHAAAEVEHATREMSEEVGLYMQAAASEADARDAAEAEVRRLRGVVAELHMHTQFDCPCEDCRAERNDRCDAPPVTKHTED